MQEPILAAVIVVIYLLPAVVARLRRHKHKTAICALNILAGWTGLGWLAAAVWSLTDNVEKSQKQIDEEFARIQRQWDDWNSAGAAYGDSFTRPKRR